MKNTDQSRLESALKSTKTCRGCNFTPTWDEQKRQLGRLVRHGFSVEAAKKLMPLCYRCATAVLRQQAPAAGASTGTRSGGVSRISYVSDLCTHPKIGGACKGH